MNNYDNHLDDVYYSPAYANDPSNIHHSKKGDNKSLYDECSIKTDVSNEKVDISTAFVVTVFAIILFAFFFK